MTKTNSFTGEISFAGTEDALNHALDIFDNPEEKQKIAVIRGQYEKRFKLEKSFEFQNPFRAMILATKIQLFSECLAECDIISKCALKVNEE